MQMDTNKKINLFILVLSLIVLTFGYIVIFGIPSTFGVEEAVDEGGNSGESYGTIPAVTTIVSTTTEGEYCKDFNITGDDIFTLGISSNYRNEAGKGAFKFYKYTAKSKCSGDNSEYTAYCLDPNLSGPTTNDGYIGYGWERDIVPGESGSVAKFDLGITYIYQNGYPNHELGSGLNTETQFAITNMAARFLTFHYGFNNGAGDDGSKDKAAYKSTVYYIDHGSCDGYADGSDACEKYRMRTSGSNTTPNGATAYSIAVDLYKKARDAKESDIWKHDLKFSDTVDVEKSTVEDSGNFVKNATGTLSGLSAFNGDDPTKSYVNNLRVTCDNSAVTCEIVDEAGNPIGADQLLNKGADELKYKVKISGNLANLTKKDIKVTVEVDFFDVRDYRTSMVVYNNAQTQTLNLQRMTMFAKNTKRSLKQEFTISMCDIDISQFEGIEAIENYFFNYCDTTCFKSPKLDPDNAQFDEDEFKEYGCCSQIAVDDPLYEQYCSINCLKNDLPNTCSDQGEIVEAHVQEGVEKGTDKVNYDLCVIDKDLNSVQYAPKKDLAGNDLKLATGDVDLSKNRYCSVACIESWDFTLPGAIYEVRAGTYFMLSAKMKGTRTCVTNDIKYGSQDGQDKDGYFLHDLDKINEDIVNKYNELNKLQEVKKAIDDAATEASATCTFSGQAPTCNAGNHQSSDVLTREYKVAKDIADSAITYYKYEKGAKPGDGKVVVEKTGSLKDGEKNVFVQNQYGKLEPKNNTPNNCNCTFEGEDYTDDENYQNLVARIEPLQQELNELIEERDQIIKEIQDCSKWTNDYNFDPVLSYSYQEDYYMSQFIKNNNYFISTVKEDEMTADADAPLYCQDSYADDYYECSGTSTSETENKNIVICSFEEGSAGCTNQEISVPKNQNIKLTESRQALYKPYTVFYTIHSSGEVNGEAVDLDNDVEEPGVITRFGRVFPVRLTTPKGVYNYKFVFNKIGQYNDSDTDLGRLMNYNNTDTSDTVPEVTVNSEFITNRPNVYDAVGFSPTYLCTYEVYEDVCKCCGTDDFDITTGQSSSLGSTNSGGSGSANGFGFNDEGYFTYYYRPISLTDPFPNSSTDGGLSSNRPMGSNWTNEKGQQVYNAITSNGEFAYDSPEYSYILTPTGTANIREYNRQQEAQGGFNDFNLTCNAAGYDCTSSFLDNLNDIVGYDATASRNTTGFVHFKEEELKYDEGKMPTGVGPSMK